MRLFVLLIAMLLADSISAQTFIIDNHKSHIGFEIKNFGATVGGAFTQFSGVIQFDVHKPVEIKFDVTVISTSITTGITMRDNHLRKKDYFNVAEFPTIQFTSTQVTLTKAGEGVVSGMLTMKGISKLISVPFRYDCKTSAPQFTGTYRLNRREFKIGGSSISMSDEVEISLQIETQAKN